jgi:multidrug efflux pump subunit AcrA (membrane-fusion protein)
MKGMSAYRTLELAQERWADFAAVAQQRGEKVRVGEYVARIALEPGGGFSYQDTGREDGHIVLFGDPDSLASAVVEIVPAQRYDQRYVRSSRP